MGPHKFALGETVQFRKKGWGRSGARGLYEVVRLLPSDGAENLYRLKSTADIEERVAREVELVSSQPGPAA